MLQDVETELSVLSAVIEHGKDGWVEICDIVECDTLAGQNNQVYFKCVELAISKSDKIDKPLFLSSAHSLGLDSIVKENMKEVDKLFSSSCELRNVRLNAKKLAKLKVARTGRGFLRTAMSELETLTGDETANNILSIIEKPGYSTQRILNSTNESGQLIGKGTKELLRHLITNPNREIGISSGMKYYDKGIGGGFRRGGFALVAARPKSGKTSFAINTSMFVSGKLKIPVLYGDSEMTPEQHQYRMLSNLTSIPISMIEHSRFTGNKGFVRQLDEAADYLECLDITHESFSKKDFDEILSIARRWAVKHVGYSSSGKLNNCLFVHDYFRLTDSSSLNKMKEYEAIGYQSSALHDFLKEMDMAGLAMVQLNKEKDISQSDRLSWSATSVAKLMLKTPDEIAADGYENGNRKMCFGDNLMRFGAGLDPDDHINIAFNGECCQMTEICTALELADEQRIGNSGFRMKKDNEDDAPF